MRLQLPHPSPLRRRPVFVLAALLLLFIAALVLATTPGPAQAQTPTTVKLVGNTGQDTNAHLGDVADYSQEFSTGRHIYGYTLTGIQLDLGIDGSSLPSYEVEIWQSSTKLSTLTKPSTLATGLNSFTHPGIHLSPSTTYRVVIDVSSAGSSWRIRDTASDGEDPGGAAGWEIADGGKYRLRASIDSYGPLPEGTTLKMAVHGYENPKQRFVGNTGKANNSLLSHAVDSAQAFSTGSHTYGYTLTEVQLDLSITGSSLPSYKVEIWSADSSGLPTGTAALGTLTKPSTLTTGLNSFTHPGFHLEPSTAYVVVVDLSSAGTHWGVRGTNSDGEDTGGASGWAITDNAWTRSRSASAWSSDTRSLKMAVHGYENERQRFVGNTAKANTSTTFASNDVAQPFTTGLHPTGYTLTEVRIELTITGSSLPSYEVEIWSADSGGKPSAKVGTLTKPSALANGLNTFTSASGVRLDRKTDYVVVLDLSSAGEHWGIRQINDDGEDPGGLSGWGIRDNSWTRARDRIRRVGK